MATNNQSKNKSRNQSGNQSKNKEFTFDDFNNVMDSLAGKVLGPYWLAWVENKILKVFDPSFLDATDMGTNNNYKNNNNKRKK